VSPDDPTIDDYIDKIIIEIRQASRDGLLTHIKTIYMGGGTPSFLGQKRLVRLLYMLSASMNLTTSVEFTMECNPESLTPAMVRDVFSLGVNRFSVGVQSFHDAELKSLGRIHDVKQALQAITAIHERTNNIAIDLMCGIPGQDIASWVDNIRLAIKYDIAHISVYPLTIEDGTQLARQVRLGRIPAPDDDVQASMMEASASLLREAGLERYEVASYAKSGYECKHNISYWTGVPYLGIGHGAAGMRMCEDGGRERLLDGQVIEHLTHEQAVIEDLMLGMRMSRGASEEAVRNAAELIPNVNATFEELIELRLVKLEDGRYKPTGRGWLLGNELFGRIWALADNATDDEHTCDDV
jgi:oxygen-independent coproporphyrinogen-3 oxidase